MSRVGKLPVRIPEKVDVKANGAVVSVKGQMVRWKSTLNLL